MESEGQYYSAAVRGSKQSILFLSFTRVSETENPSGPFTGGGSLLTSLLFLLFLFIIIRNPEHFARLSSLKQTTVYIRFHLEGFSSAYISELLQKQKPNIIWSSDLLVQKIVLSVYGLFLNFDKQVLNLETDHKAN